MSSDSSTSFNVYNTPPSGSDNSSLDPREKSSDDGTLVAGDYVTLNLLGSGGFASVFKAQSKEDQEFYAIKVMLRVHEEYGSQDELIMNEINILKNLRHPSIIGYHGFYRTDSHYHLVQELAAGGDLRRKIPFSEKQAKIYIMDLAKAIEYLHRNNIIHRDLKPENVLLTSDNQIKLADFGLSVKTLSGSVTGSCGTPYAQAPEVINGGPYTFSVDWWGLGIISYEMVMKKQPFMAETPEELNDQIKYAEVEFPSSVSPQFCTLVSSLLKKDPRERLDCLEKVLEQEFFSDVVSSLSYGF
ncbi:kinase-like domain-containing protein [Melampsora americana]|nr:kinase-like domain-containing protein [Melampsora americana]